MHLKEELEQRGLLKQATNNDLFDLYDVWGQTFYVWMDPTADSLHLWNFVWFMHALQYMKRWNKLIFIVWWATWMIGDPWGKNSERSFLDKETLASNVEKITSQVHTLIAHIKELSWVDCKVEVMNNLDFYTWVGYIDFLRDVGKYVTINAMMKKETVKKRIEDPDQSISYTEFSYMLMQWYDFFHLRKKKQCMLQIAWSDQWWNIVTWIELIRKLGDAEAYAATTPLVVDSTGKKFGKSEWNALWLSPEKNSPYVIYQYFMNTTDEDISTYLRLFSLIPLEEVEKIITQHTNDTAQRYGQQRLAYLVTELIFGTQAADHAVNITTLLFSTKDIISELQSWDNVAIHALHQATWWALCNESSIRIADACTLSGLTTSNGEAKKAIKEGIIHINEQKIQDLWHEITNEHSTKNLILLRKWKKSWKSFMFTS